MSLAALKCVDLEETGGGCASDDAYWALGDALVKVLVPYRVHPTFQRTENFMEVFERLTTEERIDLVAAAKSTLRRDGGDSTDFLWRGEMFHYGKTTNGVYMIGEGIEEIQQGLATLDPVTDEMPFPGYYEPDAQQLKQMTDSELLVKIAWSDADDGPYHEEVRRRYPRNKGAP